MTIAWLLAAAALMILRPTGSREPPERRRRRQRRELSPRTLAVIAGVAVGGGCVAVLGVGHGVVAALAAVPLGVVAVRRLQARPARSRAEPALPLALDLIAVAMRAGQPLDRAVVAAAPAAGTLAGELTRAGRLLRLGADPGDAWSAVSQRRELASIAVVSRRSASSGIRLAAGFDALADDLRAQARERGIARAHRAGVLTAAPLGLCFLPAFVCLGIVPALVGLATGLLT